MAFFSKANIPERVTSSIRKKKKERMANIHLQGEFPTIIQSEVG